jgi:probable phosphoglycerate mutase
VALDVYLLRHGETAWTRTGQHTGGTDLPLLPAGEDQARHLGALLRGVEFAGVWSSDMRRARETAALAGFAHPQVTPLLREFDYGQYEGMTTDEIHRRQPGWEIYRDGCPGGESPGRLVARTREFLECLAGQEGRFAVFSHGHFLRALGAMWAALDLEAAARLALDTGAICILHDGDRGRVLQRWNWVPDVVGTSSGH